MKPISRLLLAGFLACASFGVAAQAAAGSANLAWTAPVGDPALVTGYNMYWNTASMVGVALPATTKKAATVTSGVVTGLTAGVKYYFVVTATGPGGESGPSNEASITIPFGKPGAVTNLSVTGTP